VTEQKHYIMELTELHQQVLTFANANPVCHMATVEGDQPHVRGLHMWYADESGFYFHTASTKSLATQIEKHPKVELAFLHVEEDPMKTQELRVCGRIEILQDKNLEKRLLAERPWLQMLEGSTADMKLVIFRVVKGEAFIWDMTHNLRENTILRCVI